jgi:hypothetical protein
MINQLRYKLIHCKRLLSKQPLLILLLLQSPYADGLSQFRQANYKNLKTGYVEHKTKQVNHSTKRHKSKTKKKEDAKVHFPVSKPVPIPPKKGTTTRKNSKSTYQPALNPSVVFEIRSILKMQSAWGYDKCLKLLIPTSQHGILFLSIKNPKGLNL